MRLSWKRATLEPLPPLQGEESSPQPIGGSARKGWGQGACGAGHRPMSPLPEDFAGRSPQPAMEAGGAGKPTEAAFVKPHEPAALGLRWPLASLEAGGAGNPGGQEEELPAAPRQRLPGAYGGDGGLERSAAARVEAEGGRRVSGISLPPRKRPACHPP
ncbi:unnamed protein product [Boreogadus saida]